MRNKNAQPLGCDYTGYEFGARYPDSTCIEGYLWDMDSGGCDESGNSYLDNGGDIPCPQCNMREHIEYYAEEWIEQGYMSLEDGIPKAKIKKLFPSLNARFRRKAKRHWHKGRREAIRDMKKKAKQTQATKVN